jgi:hypothetical protein
MPKKIIINESTLKRLMFEEYINKNDIPSIIKNNPEVKRSIDDIVKSSLKDDKEIEKKVKEIVAKAVNTLFKTLWQRSNFYEDEIKR